VVHTSPSRRFQELQGTDFYPNPSGQYTLYSDDDITVSAASMAHSIPCVGFVVTEKDKPGSLRIGRISDCIARNRAGLDEHYAGVKNGHLNIYKELKALKADEVFTFPDGTSVTGREVCDPPLPGRKVRTVLFRYFACCCLLWYWSGCCLLGCCDICVGKVYVVEVCG